MQTLGRVARWLAPALVVGALAASAGAGLDADARGGLARYVFILASAGFGVAATHLLFPDPHARRLGLVNPPPAALVRRLLERMTPWALALATPGVVLGMGGGGAGLAAEGALAGLGLGLWATARVGGLGERMRAWEAGHAGGVYRGLGRILPTLRFQVPDGLVPGLLVTADVFLAGAAVAIVGEARPAWGVGAALGLVIVGAWGVARIVPRADRAFWTTHGAWADAFHESAGPDESRAPIRPEAVYWAPARLRPSVWGVLVGLDRRTPLGRVTGAALAVVVLAEVARAPEAAVRMAVVAVVLGVAWATARGVARVPPTFRTRLHGRAVWAGVSFLAAVRWLPPVAAAVLLAAGLSDRVGLADVLAATLAATLAAALAALPMLLRRA